MPNTTLTTTKSLWHSAYALREAADGIRIDYRYALTKVEANSNPRTFAEADRGLVNTATGESQPVAIAHRHRATAAAHYAAQLLTLWTSAAQALAYGCAGALLSATSGHPVERCDITGFEDIDRLPALPEHAQTTLHTLRDRAVQTALAARAAQLRGDAPDERAAAAWHAYGLELYQQLREEIRRVNLQSS